MIRKMIFAKVFQEWNICSKNFDQNIFDEKFWWKTVFEEMFSSNFFWRNYRTLRLEKMIFEKYFKWETYYAQKMLTKKIVDGKLFFRKSFCNLKNFPINIFWRNYRTKWLEKWFSQKYFKWETYYAQKMSTKKNFWWKTVFEEIILQS